MKSLNFLHLAFPRAVTMKSSLGNSILDNGNWKNVVEEDFKSGMMEKYMKGFERKVSLMTLDEWYMQMGIFMKANLGRAKCVEVVSSIK